MSIQAHLQRINTSLCERAIALHLEQLKLRKPIQTTLKTEFPSIKGTDSQCRASNDCD